MEELHKEAVRIRPCMFAMNQDNLCRLLYLVPLRFFVYDSTQMEMLIVQEEEALEV